MPKFHSAVHKRQHKRVEVEKDAVLKLKNMFRTFCFGAMLIFDVRVLVK